MSGGVVRELELCFFAYSLGVSAFSPFLCLCCAPPHHRACMLLLVFRLASAILFVSTLPSCPLSITQYSWCRRPFAPHLSLHIILQSIKVRAQEGKSKWEQHVYRSLARRAAAKSTTADCCTGICLQVGGETWTQRPMSGNWRAVMGGTGTFDLTSAWAL